MSASPAAAEAALSPALTAAVTPNEIPLEDMRKSFGDLEQALINVDKLPVPEAAERIARVDEWLYRPDEEEKALKRIDAEVVKLRDRIETSVRMLSDEAIRAKDGTSASKKMAEINALLLLYPAPGNAAQRAKLEKLSAEILNTSRRVEDIRRLRYNQWAIAQIEKGLKTYREHVEVRRTTDLRKMGEQLKKIVQVDENSLIRSSVKTMGQIDPSFLEPAALDLYGYVFGLIRDEMGDDTKRIALARGFADPSITRRTPASF